jgi:phosphoribosylamine--glycine ligase
VSRVVVVGSGGREHALAWALARSAHVVVTPGSDGMRAAGLWCTSASPVDLEADLFVIGPEVPLVAGLADTLRAQGKTVFGPNADGARLEGSKAYMKELLAAANVPTAAFGSFTDVDEALRMLRTMNPPYVVKTDGLAAGKGVLVTDSLADAEADVRAKLSGAAFGDAGSRIVIEEGLAGDECSLLVLVDGQRAMALPPAQDFKRLGDGGVGPNTGGMGAFAPLSTMSIPLVDEVMAHTIEPTLRELRRRGIDYRGVLYAGLMLTGSGPKLLEYNVRFGDPETQALVPLVAEDLDGLLLAAARGTLFSPPRIHPGGSVTVVLAAAGYPTAPRAGDVIEGLGADGQLAEPREGVTVFHAGTRLDELGRFVTAGGRVLNVTAVGASIEQARERAYAAADGVRFSGRQMRTDIASAHG